MTKFDQNLTKNQQNLMLEIQKHCYVSCVFFVENLFGDRREKRAGPRKPFVGRLKVIVGPGKWKIAK